MEPNSLNDFLSQVVNNKESKYLNVSWDNKKEEAKLEAFILPDINYFNDNNYINVFRGNKKENDAQLAEFILTNINIYNGINYINFVKENKRKKDSNGMVESNRLSPDYTYCSKSKYLNVSVSLDEDRARMAEWLTQPVVLRCPSGFVGSQK